MRNFAGNVSLRTMLLLPFVALIVMAFAVTSYLAFYGGQTSVNDVLAQLCDEIVARIELHLDGYLSQPHLINRLNAVAMEQGLVNPEDLDGLAHFLWRRGQVFPGIGSIGFANARGEVVSANEPENYIALSSQALTGGAIRRYMPDAQGYRSDQILSEQLNYDARTRGWYQQAMVVDHPIWTEINLSTTSARLDETAVLPYRDQTGQLVGVFFVDVSLTQLNLFLDELTVGQSGKIFIMEPDGFLVASSISESISVSSGNTTQRCMAADSEDPLIAFAARQAMTLLERNDALQVPYHDALTFQGVRYYLHLSPYVDGYGLLWWVVVAIPDTDFMTRIRTNVWNIALIFAMALLAFIGLAVFVSRWVTQPLVHLSRSAQALAQGDWAHTMVATRVKEASALARAFSVMAAQLQATFASLRDGEAHYRNLFEHSPISLWEEDFSDIKAYLDSLCVGDSEWHVYFERHPEVISECVARVKVLSVNRATLLMFGAADQAELLEAAPWIFGDNFSAIFREELLTLLDGRGLFEGESISQTLRGDQIRVKVRLSLSPEHTNTWSKVLVALTNITEQKLATEALAKERLLLRLVIDNLPDAVYAKDMMGRKILANRADLVNIGMSESEVLGRTDEETFPPDTAAHFSADDRTVLATGEPVVNREELLTNAAGKRCWLLTTKLPMRDEAGEIIGLVGIGRDITDKKYAETALRESAQQLQQVMDTVPAGVLLLEAGGRIVLANSPARRYLASLAGDEACDTLTHLGNRPLKELLTVPPQGVWHDVASGQRFFEVSGRMLEAISDPERWVLVIRDVTQEREIQHNVQRQERLAAVGQLAAGIAHDFNNILAGIMLYSQMSLRTPDLPPKVIERLQVIIEQAQRAAELINQILDFSRRAVLDKRPLDLVPFVKEQVKLWTRTLPESIRIVCNTDVDVCLVNADLTRMQQMLMNLALNARDAMPDGGVLSLDLTTLRVKRAASAPLPEMLPGDWIRLSVSDTGTGISDDVLQRLFTPFFTTKAPGKGTGLGLAQVYGIVTSHEGRIDVETQVGKGTTFCIFLPLLGDTKVYHQVQTKSDLPMGNGEMILVVEDNEMTRVAIVESLQLLGYRTLEAAQGQEALEILGRRRDEIALILSDMVMPEMGGKALARALHRQAVSVPLVMMSGHPLDREDTDLRAAGVTEWIQKPLDLTQLADLLARVLAGNPQ
ncbi:MAG: PAS domain S-box protein [Anaerolineae bacterium]|nr:PAS domain S-box protein [Anaerolineae bacterium]